MAKRKTEPTLEERIQDNHLLASFIYIAGDQGGWKWVGALAREVLKLRSVDPEKVEYLLGRYQGEERVVVMRAGQYVRDYTEGETLASG